MLSLGYICALPFSRMWRIEWLDVARDFPYIFLDKILFLNNNLLKNDKKYLTKEKKGICSRIQACSYFFIFLSMNGRSKQERISSLYTVVNALFYLYSAGVILILIFFPIMTFAGEATIAELIAYVLEFISTPKGLATALVSLLSILIVLGVNVYLLFTLRKVARNMKGGQIFTEENARSIRMLFYCFAIIFVVTGAAVSGGTLSLIGAVFIWLLYEIFFIGFDYKKENEALHAENTLTI